MFHQFMLIQDKTEPSRFYVEIDGKPVRIKSADIHVGVNEIPSVKIELLSAPVIKIDADMEIDDGA